MHVPSDCDFREEIRRDKRPRTFDRGHPQFSFAQAITYRSPIDRGSHSRVSFWLGTRGSIRSSTA
jgi:hypothetical protein